MKFSTAEETLGYETQQEQSNTDRRFLVSGSRDVLVDAQKKVKTRGGYMRLGAANTALTEIRNAWTWNTSTGIKLPQRFYDDELEVYLGTVDTYSINAWTRVKSGWSTTEKLRSCIRHGGNGGIYDVTEKIDLQIMVNGSDKLYEWNGAIAVVSSIEATTVTKQGTTTFAANRFYTTRNKTFVCVRTGTEYTYTGGETTTTLTGITDTAGLQANDILIQKVIETDNKPADGRINHTVYNFENHLILGSEDDSLIYVSQGDDYGDFTLSTPRVAGEGALLTLDNPTRAISALGKVLLVFAGQSSVFRSEMESLTVGTTLTETLKIKRLDTGIGQGALNQESVVEIGDSLAYLTNEVALRIIESPENLTGITPKTFSNSIKPDFDAEDWLNGADPSAFGMWYKNILLFSAPQGSHTYMLNFVQDADGKLFRFWNPPQTLPVGAISLIDLDDGKGVQLYGHSNSVPETYRLFAGTSDGQYEGMEAEEKLPIYAKAIFAYNNYKNRTALKNFDEYYVDGEITPNTTDLLMTLKYDFGGVTQVIEQTIDGSNNSILKGFVDSNSLAQQSLALNPLGGLLNPPANAKNFSNIFEIAKEDFYELQTSFETNEVDRYWAIISHGANTVLSNRRPINIKN